MEIQDLNFKKEQFAARKVGEELVLVPLKNNIAQMTEMFTLNPVAAFIWENINDQTTETDLIQKIVEEFDVDIQTAKEDLMQFVSEINSISIGQ